MLVLLNYVLAIIDIDIFQAHNKIKHPSLRNILTLLKMEWFS